MEEPVYTKRELMRILNVDEPTLKKLEMRAGVYGQRSQWHTAKEASRIKDLWKQKQTEAKSK